MLHYSTHSVVIFLIFLPIIYDIAVIYINYLYAILSNTLLLFQENSYLLDH